MPRPNLLFLLLTSCGLLKSLKRSSIAPKSACSASPCTRSERISDRLAKSKPGSLKFYAERIHKTRSCIVGILSEDVYHERCCTVAVQDRLSAGDTHRFKLLVAVLEPIGGANIFVQIAHTGLNRVPSLLSAGVCAVLKMPAACPSRITEHQRCSSTLLSVLLSMMRRVGHESNYLNHV